MAHEEVLEGMYEDERNFRKSFVEMFKMEKILYKDRNLRLEGEISKLLKGYGGKGYKPPKGNG